MILYGIGGISACKSVVVLLLGVLFRASMLDKGGSLWRMGEQIMCSLRNPFGARPGCFMTYALYSYIAHILESHASYMLAVGPVQ